MKTILFLLIIGSIAGMVGWRYYQRNQKPTLAEMAATSAEKERTATPSPPGTAARPAEPGLTKANIKEELARTGRVVRSNARIIGERMDDARIVAVIKGKYLLEKELSVLAVSVDCRDGRVELKGSVATEENIARAITLALQTNGVINVVSRLTVRG